MKFSVLLSLYVKEQANYFKECMESVLKQSVPPDEIVVVKDGPLTEELEKVLEEYVNANPKLYKIVALAENHGLGYALAEGVKRCSYELIARMDTDDVCRNDRFELQLKEFETDPDLDICGGQIYEFEENVNNVVASRTVPLEDEEIKKYQKRRDAFNHMTVMYKKSAVLKAGNYQTCLLMEDTLLWANMIMTGAKCKNINESLVYARIGKDMYERRGGFSYFKKYKAGRKRLKNIGFIGGWNYFSSLAVQFIVALLPNKWRGWLFKRVLHKRK
ncbi:MAG: glycosyltransferase [Candidatus Borkfalkiaceae bacterium]|nr:glycosyltransferase [Clostridia bacterium]MDY6223588.1 glycosyltransferase [Christensenellaceae bacterium]